MAAITLTYGVLFARGMSAAAGAGADAGRGAEMRPAKGAGEGTDRLSARAEP